MTATIRRNIVALTVQQFIKIATLSKPRFYVQILSYSCTI